MFTRLIKQKFAVMDDICIIEDGLTLEELTSQEDRIRSENPDIEGDLKFIEILGISN